MSTGAGGAPSAPFGPRRVRSPHGEPMKAEGHKWPMFTAYDYSTPRVFDEAGIRRRRRLGCQCGLRLQHHRPRVDGRTDATGPRSSPGCPARLAVGDLPFGSYEASPPQALDTARGS